MYLFLGDTVFTKLSQAHGHLLLGDTVFTNLSMAHGHLFLFFNAISTFVVYLML